MSAPIPALGHRSRTAAARALQARGLNDRQIAAQLGISAKNVGALLASAARAKKASSVAPAIVRDEGLPPGRWRRDGHFVRVSPSTWARLISMLPDEGAAA